ncbi:GNAT family N-acetyltransferase [Metabacillus iocasae]|uniref:Ribosomal-protein-alanine N-acetyltransferase n=1 Tax=Priestia iocasae TaxID=2291674 RepID=A0ABS2QTP4_9BACI|nr:ribosomal-protein-alanine N-acetyltransferase [Metabacillus iocasae]
MGIYIELLKEEDAYELLRFERDNRAFFEQMVPSRGEEYYDWDTFQVRHNELLKEHDDGTSFFYLIRNEEEQLVGRVNLVDINFVERSGHIGYRVGERHVGKGIAYQAVQLLLTEVMQKGIKTIHAKTTKENVASQKVLKRNEFEEEIDNEPFFVHYRWHAK